MRIVEMSRVVLFSWIGLVAIEPAAVAAEETMMTAIKHYQALGENASLRLVERLGSFGNAVEGLAFSRNGKFLVIAEGGMYDAKIHVWDVEARAFKGAPIAIDGHGDFNPTSRPVSVAASNDGRYVAVARMVFAVYDLDSGKSKLRLPPPQANVQDADVAHVAFSDDDAMLFTILEDGRFIARDTEKWKIRETVKGMYGYAKGLRVSGDGEFVTGVGGGPFLWTKESKKSEPLQATGRILFGDRCAARPESEHYATIVGREELMAPKRTFEGVNLAGDDDPNAGEKASENGSFLETRKYEDSKTVWKRLENPSWGLLFAVEPVGANHIAGTFTRRGPAASKERFSGGYAEWGLRIWNVQRQEVVAEAYVPSTIYRAAASNGGRMLATVVEREHVVLVWRFNPKGALDKAYAKQPAWGPPARLRWEREAFEKTPKSVLEEKGNGVWTFSHEGKTVELKEKGRSMGEVVLEGDGAEHHFFNIGTYWTAGFGKETIFKTHPNAYGYSSGFREARKDAEKWEHRTEGEWHAEGLEPRRRKEGG